MSNTPKNGGRREGAGRPPNKVAKVALTVKIDPEAKARLDFICKINGLSQAMQIQALIDSRDRAGYVIGHADSYEGFNTHKI